MNEKHDIKLSALSLAIGQTLPLDVCPFCTGGMGREKSLSVTRKDAGALYNWFRAGCGEKGIVPDGAACAVNPTG